MTTRVQKISRRQERRAARDIGGLVQHNSGALPIGGGGDARVARRIRLECKYTDKKFYLLTTQTLEKLRLQAIKGGLETPILQVGYRDELGRLDNYAVMRKGDYEAWGGLLLPRLDNFIIGQQYKLALTELAELHHRGVPLFLTFPGEKEHDKARTWVVIPWVMYLSLQEGQC